MGREKDFDQIFRLYHQPMKAVAAKFAGTSDADDVVSNLFIRLWNKQVTFESREHLQSFLYRSLHNGCLDHLKKLKNSTTAEQAASLESLRETEAYLQEMIRSEVLAEVYRAINGLPPQWGRVLTLSYIDGLSNDEIAAQMNISNQVVKNYKFRGLKVLRSSLSGDALLLLMLFLKAR